MLAVMIVDLVMHCRYLLMIKEKGKKRRLREVEDKERQQEIKEYQRDDASRSI